MRTEFYTYHEGDVPARSGWIVSATDQDDCTVSNWHADTWEEAVQCAADALAQGAYEVCIRFREA